MKRNRFYKTSPHGGVGSNVCFHGVKGRGYVTNIDDAHIYTREEAQAEVGNGVLRDYQEQELFLSADHVDALCVWRVDHQHMELVYPESKDQKNEYVMFKKGRWDGNDLSFASGASPDYNYSNARVFSEQELKDIDTAVWGITPKSHMDVIARRTFQCVNINRRKMISSAGITGIHKKRKSHDSGKTRWNCPTCGKITWQYHPYEFMSCVDTTCEKYDGYLAACG